MIEIEFNQVGQGKNPKLRVSSHVHIAPQLVLENTKKPATSDSSLEPI